MNMKNQGSGGSYVIGADGLRTLSERTKEAHDQVKQPEEAQPEISDAGTKTSKANVSKDAQTKSEKGQRN